MINSSVDRGSPWTFLTNHAHVLLCISQDQDILLREVAARVGITERAAQQVVTDLVRAGYHPHARGAPQPLRGRAAATAAAPHRARSRHRRAARRPHPHVDACGGADRAGGRPLIATSPEHAGNGAARGGSLSRDDERTEANLAPLSIRSLCRADVQPMYICHTPSSRSVRDVRPCRTSLVTA